MEINSGYIWGYNNLVKIYQELKEYDKVIEIFKKGIEKDCNFIWNYINLGEVYQELKDYTSLVKDCFSVIEINLEGNGIENLFERILKIKNKTVCKMIVKI